MKIEPYFSYVVTTVLLSLAGVQHSAAFAYAAVSALLLTIVRTGYDRYLESKVFKTEIPEEVKKSQQFLEQRITAIEAGIRKRGF